MMGFYSYNTLLIINLNEIVVPKITLLNLKTIKICKQICTAEQKQVQRFYKFSLPWLTIK